MSIEWLSVSVRVGQDDLAGYLSGKEDADIRRRLVMEANPIRPSVGDVIFVNGSEYLVYDRDDECLEPFSGEHYDLFIELKHPGSVD